MKNFLQIALGALSVAALVAPLTYVQASSISVQSLSPGATVVAKDRLTFMVTSSGFTPQTYQLTDSFTGSTANINNISGAGQFFWVPVESDIGTHTFTITAQDDSGNSVSTTQTITVSPLPSLSVGSLVPGTTVMPGSRLSFSVTALGLVSPTYIINDSFSGGSSITSTNIDASGNFLWTPDTMQNGDHSVTIYASDSHGHSASATQSFHVGAGPTLTVMLLSPGASVPIGTTTSFTVYSTNFTPTSFSVSDSFPSSSILNSNITTAGLFSWVPQASDIGVHILTIRGVVGIYGQSTTTKQTITVFGTGGSVPVAQVTTQPGTQPTAVANSTTTAPPSVGNSYIFKYFMGYGEDTTDGPDVLELQKRLVTLKFLSAVPSGYFGTVTQQAVKKFQAKHGIPATGYVGSLTRAALNK